MTPADVYNRVLARARRAAIDSSDALQEDVTKLYANLLREIATLRDFGDLTERRAAALTAAIKEITDNYAATFSDATLSGINRNATLAANAHFIAVSRAADLAQIGISTSFDDIPARALDFLVQRRDFARKNGFTAYPEFFRAVTKRNATVFAQNIETAITNAVALGQPWTDLTSSIAYLLADNDPAVTSLLHDLGPRGGFRRSVSAERRLAIQNAIPQDLARARTLLFESRRIAIHEMNSAFDESDKLASIESPMIAAVRWTRSGRHAHLPSTPDQCDLLADGDFFDLGPGVFPPESVPPLPHPFCLCFTAKLLRPPSEWNTPRPAPKPPTDLSESNAEKIFGNRYTEFTASKSEKRFLREMESARDAVTAAHGFPVRQTPRPTTKPNLPAAALPEPTVPFDTLPGGFRLPAADTSWGTLSLEEKKTYADRFVRRNLSETQLINLRYDARVKRYFGTRPTDEMIENHSRNFVGEKLPGHALDDINRALAESAGRFGLDFSAIHASTKGRALGSYTYSAKNTTSPESIRLLNIQQTAAKISRRQGFKEHDVYTKRREILIEKRRQDIEDPRRANIRDHSIQKLEEMTAAQRWSVPDSLGPDRLYGVVTHELGHALMYQTDGFELAWTTAIQSRNITRLDFNRVSEYAATNLSELFAETYTAVLTGNHSYVPEPILDAFVETMKKFGYLLD